jgi:hypothetical protein
MEEMPQDCREQSRPPHPCGLVTQEAVAEGWERFFLNKSPSIPLFQRGKKFPAPPYFKKEEISCLLISKREEISWIPFFKGGSYS